MDYKVKDIMTVLNKLAPESLALDWDAVGLQIGSPDQPVSKVFLTLDLNEGNIEEALERHPDLIVTHHPFIFSPIKHVRTDRWLGKTIQALLKKNIAVYSAHTNMDIAQGGLNDFVADKMGLIDRELLEETKEDPMMKLVVYVPDEHAEMVAGALSMAGAGHIGNYSHCSFRTQGTGTFMALEGSQPAVGHLNQMERVAETKLETVVLKSTLDEVVEAMRRVHPYEEVAYDIFSLHQGGKAEGLGRIGSLPAPVSQEAFIHLLKQVFCLEHVRWVQGVSQEIYKVAILTGSGASAINAAAAKACDALVTGDVKYHDAQLAQNKKMHLFDVGHFESEIFFANIIEAALRNYAALVNSPLTIVTSREQKNPIRTV